MEKHILRLSEEQRKLGCDVVVAFNQGDSTAANDIQVLPSVNLGRIRPQAARDLIFYLFLFFRLLPLRNSFDVMHVHGDWSAFVLGRLIAAMLKPGKLFASIHGAAKNTWIYRCSLPKYDALYCTGARDAKRLSALGNISVNWQHSGIDSIYLETEKHQPSQVDVIWAGSFVPVKNIPLVLEIAQSMPDVTFQLVGDGPQRDMIEGLCTAKRLKNIALPGRLTPVELAKHMSKTSIFLLTSYSEGTPTALLEAMACGLAVVTSESNDYSDLILEGMNGYVVRGFDSRDYRSRIRSILQDRDRLKDISERNRTAAASFGWPVVAASITQWMRHNEN